MQFSKLKLSELIARLEKEKRISSLQLDGTWIRISLSETLSLISQCQTSYTEASKGYAEILKLYIGELLRKRETTFGMRGLITIKLK